MGEGRSGPAPASAPLTVKGTASQVSVLTEEEKEGREASRPAQTRASFGLRHISFWGQCGMGLRDKTESSPHPRGLPKGRGSAWWPESRLCLTSGLGQVASLLAAQFPYL